MKEPGQSESIHGILAVLAGVKWMALLPVVYGAIYTIDCRFYSISKDNLDACYFQGATLIGIGGTMRGSANMFMAGYNTENPNITRALQARKRQEEEEEEKRKSEPS
jgi:hypothetical protein